MNLRFALPSKGPMYDGSAAFLESCNLKVSRPKPAPLYGGYSHAATGPMCCCTARRISVEKVAEGEIDLGITGLDLVEEQRGDRDDLLVIYDDLGFSRAELVIAVPDSWIDVTSWLDLADLSVELQSQGRPLRIATKYRELIRRFCYANGINYFRLIDSQGATEAAPGLGYADIIADITETGTTLRDNQLKIVGGPLLRSQACLIANRANLRDDADKRAAVKTILELVRSSPAWAPVRAGRCERSRRVGGRRWAQGRRAARSRRHARADSCASLDARRCIVRVAHGDNCGTPGSGARGDRASTHAGRRWYHRYLGAIRVHGAKRRVRAAAAGARSLVVLGSTPK